MLNSPAKVCVRFLIMFLVSVVLSYGWLTAVTPLGFILGFGMAPEPLMRIWEIGVIVGYVILISLLVLFFRKVFRIHPLAILGTAILPGVLFWVSGYVSEQRIQKFHAEYKEFYEETARTLPGSTEFLRAQYTLIGYPRDKSGINTFDFSAELHANIDHEFNSNTLDSAFDFRIDDIANKHFVDTIIPNCILFPYNVCAEKCGSGERYKPGEHKVIVEWRFYGPNCSEDDLQTLLGRKLIIRNDSKVLNSFVIENINFQYSE